MAAVPQKKKSRFRRLFGGAALFGNILAVIWLALCYAASVNSPVQYPYLALASITVPFAILANVFFVFFWLFARRRWRIALPLVALAIAWPMLRTVFPVHFSAAPSAADSSGLTFKLINWNVHGLGLFEKKEGRAKDDSILAYIVREQPDILVMPEFYTVYNNAMKPYSTTFLARGGYKEYRFKDDNSLGTKIFLGTALFSKYPVRAFEAIELAPYVFLLQADIAISPAQKVRVLAVHLQSFLLQDKEKQFLEQVKHRQVDMSGEEGKGYIRRFAAAYKKRAVQAEKVKAAIAQSPYPVLLCGDFNDLPYSYTYRTILGPLKDAFTAVGSGFGRTYHMFSPTLRIDFQFYDPVALDVISCRVPYSAHSDHNPVIGVYKLK